MNHCPACGNALSTNVKFCSECGATTSMTAPAVLETGAPAVEATPQTSTECRRCGFWTTNGDLCKGCAGDHQSDSRPASQIDASEAAARKSLKNLFIGFAIGAVVLVGGGIAFAAGGGESYEACLGNANKTYAECQASHGRSTAGSSSTPTTTATSHGQLTTCLQWRTDYTQKYVGGGLQRGTDQYGQGVLEDHGRWEQVPSGQTCVRRG